jgi:hypothetical protein
MESAHPAANRPNAKTEVTAAALRSVFETFGPSFMGSLLTWVERVCHTDWAATRKTSAKSARKKSV